MKPLVAGILVTVSLFQSAVLVSSWATYRPACLTCAAWDGIHQAERDAAWREFQRHVVPVKREKKP